MKHKKPHSNDALNVGEFLASPRHAYFFRVNQAAQEKVRSRFTQLRRTGKIDGKHPIINIQEDPDIVELHDGNASAVAWLLYAEAEGIPPTLRNFRKSFNCITILRNRMHGNGEVWHPYVPSEVKCADKLQDAWDDEQKRNVKKAITHKNEVVYFNNTAFFSGHDKSQTVGAIARGMSRLP